MWKEFHWGIKTNSAGQVLLWAPLCSGPGRAHTGHSLCWGDHSLSVLQVWCGYLGRALTLSALSPRHSHIVSVTCAQCRVLPNFPLSCRSSWTYFMLCLFFLMFLSQLLTSFRFHLFSLNLLHNCSDHYYLFSASIPSFSIFKLLSYSSCVSILSSLHTVSSLRIPKDVYWAHFNYIVLGSRGSDTLNI